MKQNIYALIDDIYFPGNKAVEFTDRLLKNHAVWKVQYRNKRSSDDEFASIAKQILKLCRKYKVPFIINDRINIAKVINADGVHLGQEDITQIQNSKFKIPWPVGPKGRQNGIKNSKLRIKNENQETICDCIKLYLGGNNKIVGISTHSVKQALDAEKLKPDYISIGPVFITNTKPHLKPIGLKIVAEVVKQLNIAVVAIGGITFDNYKKVLQTGVTAVAMAKELLSFSAMNTKM